MLLVALAVVKTAHQRELPKPVMIAVQNSSEKPHRRKPRFLLSGMLQQVGFRVSTSNRLGPALRQTSTGRVQGVHL